MPQRTTTKLSTILFCAAIPALADTKIISKYTTGGQTNETVMSAKGERVRYDLGKDASMLRQCDLQRIVQVDSAAKTFRSLPIKAEVPPANLKTEVVDTGDRKQLFGYEARHLRIVETADGKKERTETDGWYADLKGLPSCYGNLSQGLPLAYTIASFGDDGRANSTVTMQVTDVSAVALEPGLFEVPRDYKDAAQPAELKPGTKRVGAVPLRDRSHGKIATTAGFNHLRTKLQDAKIDFLTLEDGPTDAVQAKAGEAHCDYVLYTELISVERPDTGKVGGLLHRAPIVGRATDGDAFEAKLEYRLAPVGGPVPAATAVSAKTGHAINWIGAASLAANLTPMGLAAKSFGGAGMLNPMMVSALTRGGGMGMAMAGADPLMGAMSLFLRSANPAQPDPKNLPGMDAAIAAALEQEASAVIVQMKK